MEGQASMQQENIPMLEPAEVTDPQPSTVLIVDDDHDQVEVLRTRLRRQGFRPKGAYCGRTALAAAREERPDLILLDLRLPDIDGFHICSELADHPSTADIPVIILSGMERPDIIRRSRAAGCSYYVRKPYDPNALLILIEQAIQESQQW